MRSLFLLFVAVAPVGSSLVGAEQNSGAEVVPAAKVIDPAVSAPATVARVDAVDPIESSPIPEPAVQETPAVEPVVDAATEAEKPVATAPVTAPEEKAPPPSVATPEKPAEVIESASPPPAPPAPAPVVGTPAGDLRADLLAARVTLLEQQLLAQHDREVTLYRDTIRLVTIFGGAFAGLCMIGLLAASFLNYRALVAVQGAHARGPLAPAADGSGSLLAPPSAVPGIERVQASGQRFQSRVSGLEERLAELEHLAGRDAPLPADDAGPMGSVSVQAEPVIAVASPGPTVPRAMILVHKAQALTNLGKLSDALATLDEAASLDGNKTEVILARGQVLEKMGRLGDALNAYDAAVGGDEQNTSALLLKAGVLNRQERFSEALACYERALEVHRAAT